MKMRYVGQLVIAIVFVLFGEDRIPKRDGELKWENQEGPSHASFKQGERERRESELIGEWEGGKGEGFLQCEKVELLNCPLTFELKRNSCF